MRAADRSVPQKGISLWIVVQILKVERGEREPWARRTGSSAYFNENIGNQRPWGDIIYNNNASLVACDPGALRLYGVTFAVKY